MIAIVLNNKQFLLSHAITDETIRKVSESRDVLCRCSYCNLAIVLFALNLLQYQLPTGWRAEPVDYWYESGGHVLEFQHVATGRKQYVSYTGNYIITDVIIKIYSRTVLIIGYHHYFMLLPNRHIPLDIMLYP